MGYRPQWFVWAGPILTVVADPANQGTVTGPGISCGAQEQEDDCIESLSPGQQITLNASEEPGYTLHYWDDGQSCLYYDCQIPVTMDSHKTITAKFAPLPGISVSSSPANSGVVREDVLENQRINCPGDCEETLDYQQQIALKAYSVIGYKFDHWTDGTNQYADNPKTFTLSDAMNITAVFLPFRLGSPVQGQTPYTLPVTAILDHSLSGGYYGARDNIIEAYNGAIGQLVDGDPRYNCEYDAGDVILYGYKTAQSVLGGDNYPLPELNYADYCLWYDDHSGYDYSLVNNTPLYATEAGKLYKASSNPIVGNETWANFHAIYIDHGNGHYSWYLHCSSLDSDLEQQITQNGYADVIKGQFIAYSGNYPNFGYHLHFELQYKNADGQFSMADPYWYLLWEDAPQQ